MDDEVADAQVGEGREPAPGARGRSRPTAVNEPAERDHGEAQVGRDEALAERALREQQRRLLGHVRLEEPCVDPVEVVARPLRLATAGERDDHPVARAQLALELRFGLRDAAGGRDGRLRAPLPAVRAIVRVARLADAADAHDRPLGERLGDVDVQVAGVGVVHRRGDVLPVVAQRGRDLLGGGEQDRGVVADQLQRRAERVHGEQLGDVGPLPVARTSRSGSDSGYSGTFGVVGVACEFRQLAVLERQLGGRVELDPLRLAERALGEGREPADRLDLVAEQLQPRGPLLGRRKDVEDAAADRELAPLLDLVGVLVAGLDQELGDVAEIDLLAAVKDEPLGPQRRVGHRLGQRHGGRDHDRGLVAAVRRGGQRVERPDPQADQVRWRGEVGLVPGAARGVVAHAARGKVGTEGAGEVAGADVVGRDHERRAAREPLLGVDQRREQVRADRGRSAHVDRLAGGNGGREGGESLVVERYVEQ